jgi:hypothetical protein
MGATFFFYFLSHLHWYFFILAIFPAFALLVFIAGGLWSCFYIGLSLSPNRMFCWLLTAWFAFSLFSSIPEYCTPIPLLKDAIIIQLPCWAYVALQIYAFISLIVAAIVVNRNFKNKLVGGQIKEKDKEKEEQIIKMQSAKNGKLTEEFVDFIPKLVNLMEYNKQKYGKYRPDDWQIKSFEDYASRYTFDVFDLIEESKISDSEDFIKYYFEKEKEEGWGEEEHLRKHFEKIALATAIEIRRRAEGEQAKRLENAKTGEPITLTGYGVIDANGKDTGKRFIRKEDADKYLDDQKKS